MDGRYQQGGVQKRCLGSLRPQVIFPDRLASARPEHEGWWPDPTGRHEMRYFDGMSWTWKIEDQGNQRVDPKGAPQTRQSPQRG